MTEKEDILSPSQRALLVGLDTGKEDTESLICELESLAKTAGIDTVSATVQRKNEPDPATFVGSGFLKDIADFCKNNQIDAVIFDDELTPVQQKNIEKITEARVVDRTALILDIFAERAASHEGRLQVELARCKYSLARLAGGSTGLSRQGGAGHLRGSGESKLETDRRYVRRRISTLERRIKELDSRRTLIRERRRKNRIQTVAIVGYTNAGKSTLMNLMTNAGVLCEDKLFATLDPTARALNLSDGRTVMLVDTVGLIRKLPHHLVEAFRSTLKEAAEADLILNVCDASSGEYMEHLAVTEELLDSLGYDGPIVTVMNKCDLLCGNIPLSLSDDKVFISAAKNTGIPTLLTAIENKLPRKVLRCKLLIPYSEAGLLDRIRRNGILHSEDYTPEGIKVDCTADIEFLRPLEKFFID